MGFFTIPKVVTNISKGFLGSVAKVALIPAVVGGNLITAGLEKVTGKTYGRTTTEQAASTPFGKGLGLATAATAGALAVATGGAAAVLKSVAKDFIKHPIQGGAAVLIGGPLVTGLITSGSPEKNIGDITSAAYKTGAGLGTVIQEHPTAAAIIGSLTGGVAAYEIGKNLLGGTDKSGVLGSSDIIQNAPAGVSPKVTGAPPIMPTGPQTETLKKSPRRKARSKAKEAPRQIISQRVDVRVGVNAANKKYIRQVLYN